MVFNWLCQLLLCCSATGTTLTNLNRLLIDRRAVYNKFARPITNQSNPVNVWAHFEFLSIQEFDEVNEKIHVVGYFILYWLDEVMKWTPGNYGGLERITIESSAVWKPKLVLINQAGKFEKIGDDWIPIRFEYNGWAIFAPGNVFKASSSFDVTYYPWDEQTCTFIFVPWGFTRHEVSFVPISDKVGLKFATHHGVWDVIDTKAFVDIDSVNSSLFYSQIKLRRKSGFIVLNVLLPVALMSVLNILIFLIPTESGERFSYCLTVLLAIAVFMTLIGENLPKRSSPMSLLSYYLFGVLLNSVAIVLATVGSYRVYCRDTDIPVSPAFVILVKVCGCKCKRAKRRMTTSSLNGKVNGDCDGLQQEKFDDFKSSYGNGTKLEDIQITRIPDSSDCNEVSWKQVGESFDKLFFLFFSLLLFVMTATFFMLILIHNKDI